MRRDEDRRARERAQSVFDRPLVLEAGAGTGKTSALVARIVCWVLGIGWDRVGSRMQEESGRTPADEERAGRVLEGVVAITFTEAAAAEMETRVGASLAEIAAGGLPAHLLHSVLPGEEAARVERAEWLLAALDRLQVRTIHSWCHRILARFPFEAGLHPDFQVDAEGRQRRDAALEVVEAHLRQSYHDELESARLQLASDGRGPADLAEALTELSGRGMRAHELRVSPFSGAPLAAFVRELLELLEQVGETRLQELTAIPRAPSAKKIAHWIQTLLAELRDNPPTSAAALQSLLDQLDEADTRSCLNKLEKWAVGEFTGGESSSLSARSQRFWSGFAPGLVSWMSELSGLRPEMLEAARTVLQPLLENLERRLHALGVLSYEDLLRRTRELLDADNGVRQLLREEIDQLLVDEFQDTNALQCEIVARIALQGPAEKRPGLFLVGDPKQSIYGWRGAELSAYHRFVERIEAEYGPREYLSVNFRSVPAILREVERAVRPVMQERLGDQPAFQELLASEANEAREGYRSADRRTVEHWISGMRAPEEMEPGGSRQATRLETQRLVADLLALKREKGAELRWSEIGLLYRSGGDLEQYLRELRRADIPYSVENDRQYFRRREIMDAVALLGCILQPADQLAMMAYLRSPWVGVPDAAWLGLWRHGFPGRFARLHGPDPELLDELAAAIAAGSRESGSGFEALDRIGGWEESLRHAVSVIAALRASFGQDAPEVFVRKLRHWTSIEAREASRFLGPYRAANLERFFRVLRDTLCKTGEDPDSVLRQLKRGVLEESEAQEGRLQASAKDAVRVMTIHKAKGLDFEHVYLLQTHKRGRAASAGHATELSSLGDRWEYLLLGYPSPGWHRARMREGEVARFERVRLLYVAVTRAKSRLVTLGRREEGAGDPLRANSLSELLAPRAAFARLEDETRRCCLEGSDPRFLERTGPDEGDEVLWRLLPLEAGETASAWKSATPSASTSVSEVLADEASLAEKRRRARHRMQRPFRRGASWAGHEALREARETRADEPAIPGRGTGSEPPVEARARLAMAVGSAVHAALEHYVLEGEPAAAWKDAQSWAERELADELDGSELEEGRDAAHDILRELDGSSVLDELRRLAPWILGREIPVLVTADPRDEEGPVGYHPGAIDLLYRDPESGELVVADFKTDRVDDSESIQARVAAYRGQGEVYRRAIALALGLEQAPRFELWFLRADRIEVCR